MIKNKNKRNTEKIEKQTISHNVTTKPSSNSIFKTLYITKATF